MAGSIAATIKAYRMQAGLSVRDLQQRLTAFGVEVSEKTIYGWENGARLPDAQTLLTLCSVLEIASFAAFTQTPAPADLSLAADGKFLRQYKALDAHGKAAVQAVLMVERERMEAALQPEKKPVTVWLEHFTAPVSAGSGTVLDTVDGCEKWQVMANAYTRRADYVLTVRGRSMEPRFHNNDLILVEECDDVDFGEIGIWYLDGRSYVKQKGSDCLISLNPAYPNIKQEEYADIRCQGRVVGILDPEWLCTS